MPVPKATLARRARPISLLAMDVDGVLTGGEIIVFQSGEETKIWNAKDRLGLALARVRNIPLRFAWVTGRGSKNVTWAANDLKISYVVQKCHDKKAAVLKIMRSLGLTWKQVGFIGDDLIDLPVLRSAGFSACPADAVPDVKKNVHYVSPFPGGRGVVRDVLELVLKAQNHWNSLIKPFLS